MPINDSKQTLADATFNQALTQAGIDHIQDTQPSWILRTYRNPRKLIIKMKNLPVGVVRYLTDITSFDGRH
jgi:hypothetical protein